VTGPLADDLVPPAAGGRAASAPLVGGASEPTLFELSRPGRRAWQLPRTDVPDVDLAEVIPADHLSEPPALVEVSERDLVGHFTRLSHRQYAVDLGAYPLGSCTMKYNPKVCDQVASLPGLANVHPAAPPSTCQGWLQLLHRLEAALCAVTGMAAATLQPAAGAAGELTGLLLMRAWHARQGQPRRTVVIPDSAHGTNPASVTLGGFEVRTVPTDTDGGVDLDALRSVLDEDVAGIMLTNPNTLGLFERRIVEIAAAVHDVGGLLYYDGANLNAIMGVTRPGDMGFDIVHLNLHKTFATPHGGGGPGAGPVAVTDALAPLLPGPRPVALPDGTYGWHVDPASIGRVHSWHGNALVLARALTYILTHGDSLRTVSELAVLNARWLRQRLGDLFDTPFDEPCMHEFVVATTSLRKATGARATDVAKGLLDLGFHAPTVAFPLIVDDALMFEPTETESLQTLEAFAQACEAVVAAAVVSDPVEGPALATDPMTGIEPTGTGSGASVARAPSAPTAAPVRTPVGRVDEARAARRLVATFDDRELTPGT
jgi:glycine dehydrogenase subunit 2